jgi:hypothetical protein
VKLSQSLVKELELPSEREPQRATLLELVAQQLLVLLAQQQNLIHFR